MAGSQGTAMRRRDVPESELAEKAGYTQCWRRWWRQQRTEPRVGRWGARRVGAWTMGCGVGGGSVVRTCAAWATNCLGVTAAMHCAWAFAPEEGMQSVEAATMR